MDLTSKKNLRIGKNVRIEVDDLQIGDCVYIGDNVVIEGPKVSIGDYTMIRENTTIGGRSETQIGMCCWFGPGCILNSTQTLTIGNGVGVGAHSQLWTHMRFGDTLQGCRWESAKPLVVEDDVWFVGHCLVSPIRAARRSMAMLGSLIVKDMEENRTYAGAPAKDVTDRLGPQYLDISVEEKKTKLTLLLNQFRTGLGRDVPIEVVESWPEKEDEEISYFNVATREYTKRLSDDEIAFMMKLLVPIKFYPRESQMPLPAPATGH